MLLLGNKMLRKWKAAFLGIAVLLALAALLLWPWLSPLLLNPDRVIIVDVKSGEVIRTWRRSSATSIAFSPDGKRFAIGCLDGNIRLYGIADQRLENSVQSRGAVTSLAFSPDGRLFSYGSGGAVTLCELDGPRVVRRRVLGKHPDGVYSLSFSANGRLLSSGGMSEVIVWSLAAGKRLYTLKSRENGIDSLAFSQDGDLLASASSFPIVPAAAGGIRLWRVSDGHLTRTLKGAIGPVAFQKDSNLLMTGRALGRQDGDALVRTPVGSMYWSIPDGKVAKEFKLRNLVIKAFSTDGTLLAGSVYYDIYVYRTKTGKTTHVTHCAGRPTAVTFSPNGGLLAVSCEGPIGPRLIDFRCLD